MHGSHARVVLGLHRTRLTPQLLRAALTFGVTTVDTAPHYQHGTAHQQLIDAAGNLLDRFTVCTKIGYHHNTATGRNTHSLDPQRLWSSAEAAVRSLGQPPAVLWLHNPERSLAGLPVHHAAEQLAQAAVVLARAARRGWCRSWGIATWNPDQVLPAVAAIRDDWPRPGLVMTRSGLLTPSQALTAAEGLAARCGARLWGMSPFGGDTQDPVWREVDPCQFLAPGQESTRWQAALRLARAVPDGVERVAVGASTPAHLAELITAPRLSVNTRLVASYRRLLERRSAAETSTAASSAGARSGSVSGSVNSGARL
ncbi:Predicted oxidoreductase [Saccharopolyspora shandongensis]|uniref:Predicted oxidoreductase n=1 Tax=Saccharopolyspora shandongensis TaxID=418495 RepID=A0A1H3G9F4_9PSEU|nr:aldo/keto reductase [Saccharopolyspora shandongensis]SDX99685.1 Predicted oxidoreductase [Saccharopolyspora shandongensis]